MSQSTVYFGTNRFHLSQIVMSKKMDFKKCHGAVAQSEERPLKVPVWCNSTDVGLYRERHFISLIIL